MSTKHVVFKKNDQHECSILIPYWYAAIESEEAILLGPVEDVSNPQSISYEQARRLADKIED